MDSHSISQVVGVGFPLAEMPWLDGIKYEDADICPRYVSGEMIEDNLYLLREKEFSTFYAGTQDYAEACKVIYKSGDMSTIKSILGSEFEGDGHLLSYLDDEVEVTKSIADYCKDKITEAILDQPKENPIRIAVCDAFSSVGFVFCNYFSFVRKCSPMYRAWCGEIDLKPECFNVCMGIAITSNSEDIFRSVQGKRKDAVIAKTTQSCCSGLMKAGWKKERLISAIKEHGLSLSGQCLRDKNEILRNVLTLDLITGNERDKCVPLPGFGIKYYEEDHPVWKAIKKYNKTGDGDDNLDFDLIYWGIKKMSIEYYTMVYRKILKSDKYMNLTYEEFQRVIA